MIEKITNVVGSIIVLATVAVVVSSPRTAGIIKAGGSALGTAINAATRPTR